MDLIMSLEEKWLIKLLRIYKDGYFFEVFEVVIDWIE